MKTTKLMVLLIVAAVASLGRQFPAAADAGHWVERDCLVNFAGSNWLYINSDVTASLTNANGELTTRPGYLHIENHGTQPAYYNATGVHTFNQVINPGESRTELLPIYQSADNPVLELTVPFKVWVGGPRPGSESEDAQTAQAEKQEAAGYAKAARAYGQEEGRVRNNHNGAWSEADLSAVLDIEQREVDAMRQAVRLDPNNEDYQAFAAIGLQRLHNYTEAENYFRRAVTLDRRPATPYWWAINLLRLHRFDEAEAVEQINLRTLTPEKAKIELDEFNSELATEKEWAKQHSAQPQSAPQQSQQASNAALPSRRGPQNASETNWIDLPGADQYGLQVSYSRHGIRIHNLTNKTVQVVLVQYTVGRPDNVTPSAAGDADWNQERAFDCPFTVGPGAVVQDNQVHGQTTEKFVSVQIKSITPQ